MTSVGLRHQGVRHACAATQATRFIELNRASVRRMSLPRDYDRPDLLAGPLARGRRRALDAADPARPVLRRPPLHRPPGAPRHPARGADLAAARARRRRRGRAAALPPGRDELRPDRRAAPSCGPSVHQLMQWGERHLVAEGPAAPLLARRLRDRPELRRALPRLRRRAAGRRHRERARPGDAAPLRDDPVSSRSAARTACCSRFRARTSGPGRAARPGRCRRCRARTASATPGSA